MTWDGENRLTRLELPDGTTEEDVYRADGLRHKHVDACGTIHPIWDEQNVLLEKNAGFATQAIYTQLPGIWGGAFSFKRGATHYFLLPDLQGHTRQTLNASEALLAPYYFGAWGREVRPIVGGGLYLRPFGQWGLLERQGFEALRPCTAPAPGSGKMDEQGPDRVRWRGVESVRVCAGPRSDGGRPHRFGGRARQYRSHPRGDQQPQASRLLMPVRLARRRTPIRC